MRRSVWRAVTLVVMVALGVGGGDVSAQVEGTSYVSPNFGYSFSWDETWSVAEEASEGGYDLLQLTNEASDFYVEGFVGYQGDAVACLEDARATYSPDGDPETAVVMVGDDGAPIEGAQDGYAYAVFEVVDAEGEPPYAVFVECDPLVPGVAVLVFTLVTDLANFGEQIGAVDALLSTLSVPESGAGAVDPADLESLEAEVQRDVNGFWTEIFAAEGQSYEAPAFISFDAPIETACGDAAPEEIGPFYCPADRTVYLDQVSLANSIAPYGEAVVAAVIAHEVGHHVQDLLALEGCAAEGCGGRGGSLAIELQADCFAGAWFSDAGQRGGMAAGDLEQTIIAISAFFGDPPDTPATDPNAHGPGALRTWWFLKGYYEGVNTCFPEAA